MCNLPSTILPLCSVVHIDLFITDLYAYLLCLPPPTLTIPYQDVHLSPFSTNLHPSFMSSDPRKAVAFLYTTVVSRPRDLIYHTGLCHETRVDPILPLVHSLQTFSSDFIANECLLMLRKGQWSVILYQPLNSVCNFSFPQIWMWNMPRFNNAGTIFLSVDVCGFFRFSYDFYLNKKMWLLTKKIL